MDHRRQGRSLKNCHSRATFNSHNSSSLPEGVEKTQVAPISELRPGGINYSHPPLPDSVTPFDLQAVYTTEYSTLNRLTLSTKKQESTSGRHEPRHPRMRKYRSFTKPNFQDLKVRRYRQPKENEQDKEQLKKQGNEQDNEERRGEKWTEEEEALLRERRSQEIGESWDETKQYFPFRTTNALQKKWKIMILSDKMQIDPELEVRLLVAMAKHAPVFYRQLAMEMNMAEDEVERIEEKISILFMQGKLPIKAYCPTLMPIREDMSSPIFQRTRPASAPVPEFYSMGPHGFLPDGSGFHEALSWVPCPISHNRSPGSLSSDTEDGVPHHPDDEKVAAENNFMPSLLENEWYEEQHFHHSFLEDRSFSDYFY
ncbi:hypothetical protein EV426DRAFT_714525 [Tirmania nivea]|nr:hypothetical protein EV426DRAFT_714525 [Tirmania nivea]